MTSEVDPNQFIASTLDDININNQELIKILTKLGNSYQEFADHYKNELPRGKALFNSGLQTVTSAVATRPDNEDINNHDRLKIFEITKRISPMLTIVNYGPGTLHIIYSNDGTSFSEQELYLPTPTETIGYVWLRIRNVYEARIRSPNAATQYMGFEGYHK